MTKFSAPIFILAALLAGCAGSPKKIVEISGYVVPSASLVPEEKLRVSVALEDVSLADAPSVTLSEADYELTPYWPLPYSLNYEAELLDVRRSYAMRVRVETLGGTLLAINDISHPYSRSSDSRDFDILVKPLDRSPPIVSRFAADCAGDNYSIEVFEGFVSRFNKNSLSRQVFLRVAAASGTKYIRENETIWTKSDDQMIYLVDNIKIDCIVTPGI